MYAFRVFNNDEGVSPIVATLVLIVVAIIGAAAVGLIMGSFSSNVSNQASAGNTASTASTTLTITGAGCMGIPINQIANWYTANNTGIKVNVYSNTNSGVGMIAVEKGIANIGLVNEGPGDVNFAAHLSSYPNLKTYQVGASGVAFIASGSTPYTTITKADLTYLYTNGIPSGNTYVDHYGNTWRGVVGRSDVAGPMDIGMAYLGLNSKTVQANPNIIGENEAKLVVQNVASNSGYIGVINSEDIWGDNIVILAIDDQANSKVYTPSTTTNRTATDNIINEIKNNPSSATWPAGLIKPLNMVTNGPASSLELNLIKFYQSPTAANQNAFSQNNEVHVSQVNPAFLE